MRTPRAHVTRQADIVRGCAFLKRVDQAPIPVTERESGSAVGSLAWGSW